jgi:hypothetical protein
MTKRGGAAGAAVGVGAGQTRGADGARVRRADDSGRRGRGVDGAGGRRADDRGAEMTGRGGTAGAAVGVGAGQTRGEPR